MAAFYFDVTCLVYGHQFRKSRRHAAEALFAIVKIKSHKKSRFGFGAMKQFN